MPYAPELGLLAWTFQPLSRLHSESRQENWPPCPAASSICRAISWGDPDGALAVPDELEPDPEPVEVDDDRADCAAASRAAAARAAAAAAAARAARACAARSASSARCALCAAALIWASWSSCAR